MLKLAPLATSLLLGACSVIGLREGTESPPYRTTETLGPIEIREYGARIAAETTIDTNEVSARGEGFRRLAAYIFGANATKASIAMTAPVAQSSAPSSTTIPMTTPIAQDQTPTGWTIRFFMPAKYTMDTLPTPTDPRVRLTATPPQTMAVLRYTGTTAPEAVATRQAELLQAVAKTPYRPTAQPLAWFYDPPWTLPFLRRNEVAVAVTR